MKYNVGIDLGGTNIAVGVVNKSYKIIGRSNKKTNAPRRAEEIVSDMELAVREAAKDARIELDEISSIGIGSPGHIDSKAGMVVSAGNLKFHNVPLLNMLKERLSFDCYLENDGNCAAYGEYIAGAGKETNSFIMVTLGTGVGGGVIVSGRFVPFAEIGHIIINFNGEKCVCGKNGCWETYASASALIKQTRKAMAEHPESVMWEICQKDLFAVTGKTAFDAMRMGDTTAGGVVSKYIEYISVGVSSLIDIFSPDMVCIGGGISKEGETLVAPVKKYIKAQYDELQSECQTKIRTAQLGNDAGIIGAAFLSNLYK